MSSVFGYSCAKTESSMIRTALLTRCHSGVTLLCVTYCLVGVNTVD